MEKVIPWLCVKGVNTGDLLHSLVGPQATGLSASTITRLITTWQAGYDARSK
jgi:hypothetical protein